MRSWKVGSVTAGVLLIAIGILWFFQSFISIPYTKLIMNAWPVACILLGVEILIFHLIRKEDSLRFHGFSIFLLILVMVVSIVFSIANLFFKELGVSLQSSRVELKDEQSISTSIDEIIIEAPDGEVNVIGTNSNSIKIDGSLSIPNQKDSTERVEDYYSFKTIGNKVYVQFKKNQFHFIHFNDQQLELNIELPESLYTKIKVNNGRINLKNKLNKTELDLDDGELSIEDATGIIIAKTDNGAINIKNVNLHKDSNIMTDNGEINLENITGDLIAKSTNGSITVNHASLNNSSKITSDDGQIQLENVKGSIFARANNGSINVSNSLINGESSLITDDGSIEIDFDQMQDLKILAETDDGSFDGNIGWKKDNKDENHLNEAIIGKGTYPLKLKSSNGSITVNKNY
jgi:Putative adhesin